MWKSNKHQEKLKACQNELDACITLCEDYSINLTAPIRFVHIKVLYMN